MSLEQLEAEALKLSREERETLATNLLHSLRETEANEIDAAWVEEAERRFDELSSGKAKGIPGDNFFADIRRELGWS